MSILCMLYLKWALQDQIIVTDFLCSITPKSNVSMVTGMLLVIHKVLYL